MDRSDKIDQTFDQTAKSASDPTMKSGSFDASKDKALAEAAALLILQKKLDAYWSNVDEDN